MKILDSNQMYLVDEATLNKENITSLKLMERAATKCFDWIHNKLQRNPVKIIVFCGIGNNGGDGLVIARHLFEHNYNVSCFIVNFSDKRSSDFSHNYERLKSVGVRPTVIKDESNFPELTEYDVVIDAIFGIGLKREITGFTTKLIQDINKSKAYLLSIDIPSGLYVDRPISNGQCAIESSHTLTFQNSKLAFYLPENEKYIYTWEVLNIGLDEEFIESLDVTTFAIEKVNIQSIYKKRDTFSHKGSYGHSVIMGGSFGKIGAVTLALKSALKSGSGLATGYVPKCGYEILQVVVPEAMVEVDADNELQYFNFKSKPTVIGLGPGMGTSEKTILGLSKFLKENKLPLVIDADGLNILSKKKELLKLIPENSILTPHPKEFERLVGGWINDYDKLDKLTKFTKKHKLIVVLKGAHTIIAKDDKLYFNRTGNPALATAGSGDVLTGIITGLLAQHYEPLNAAKLGVYLHGLSADIGIEDHSQETFLASNILDYLGDAFKSLLNDKKK